MIFSSGVTTIKLDDPDQLPATMTDLDHDTWMLSGVYGSVSFFILRLIHFDA